MVITESDQSNHERIGREARVLILPYPLQGHINPILQFAKRLAFKGLKVTVLVPSSISNQASFQNGTQHSSSLDFVRIFDGYDGAPDKSDVQAYLSRLRASISQSLIGLLDQYVPSDHQTPPKMVIYDSLMPWVLNVVKKCGFKGAPFFTQSCVVNSIYYHVLKGFLNRPIMGFDHVSLPGVKSLLKVDDLPSFVTSHSLSYPLAFSNVILDQLSNIKEANCLFVNSLDSLEIEVVNWMESICPVKTIGPCIPSKYLDNRIPEDREYGLSLFEPETDACIRWLNTRESGSVVYVSMGSMASPTKNQMEEIAKALVNCNKFFIWVVRATEISKLPLDFKEETSEKGLIVSWCPQLEVLAHPALGCFVTHCGWNSILEAISLGVPIVAFPQWTDQPTNAKCVTHFWRIGVKVKADDDGFVTGEEIELCIRQVMEGESAKEIRNNATKYKQIAKETMEEGGSSARNIQDFVNELLYT